MAQSPIMVLDDLATSFGKSTREAIEQLGAIGLFFWRVVAVLPKLLTKPELLLEQMMRIGIGSLPIVCLMSMVIGFIVTWQFAYMAGGVVPLTYLGFAAGKAIFTQMGPTFTALVLAGRISAKLASELGTMKVTEQMDAMTCLSLDVFLYLFSPRVISGFIMTTVIFVYASVVTILSAQIMATLAFHVHPFTFYNGMKMHFLASDVVIMLVKGFIYGGILSSVGCYYGFITKGGAVGVGQSTKNAVVASSVMVLMSDVIINQVLM